MKTRIILSLCLIFTVSQQIRANVPEPGCRTVYASQSGVVLDSDVMNGGGTDMTSQIQAILDKAAGWGRLYFVMDGAALVSKPLRVHSNTTVFCPDNSCGFFLADGSDCCIMTNANPDLEKRKDCNITLQGGVYNHNSPGQVHHREGPETDGFISTWVFCLEFYGVENFTMRDVTIRNQRTFSLSMANWKFVDIENVHIDRIVRPDYQNQDGLHFFGPGQFLNVRNVYGNTGDDFIALAPDELDGKSSICDVLIDGIMLDDADQGIRMLSRGEGRLDRVTVRNVTGTFLKFGFYINPWVEGSGGNFGNIVLENIDLRLKKKQNYVFRKSPFYFKIGGNIESLTLRNVNLYDNRCDYKPFYVGGEYVDEGPCTPLTPTHIKRLVIDGLYVHESDPSGFLPEYLSLNGGRIDLLAFKHVIFRREGQQAPSGSSLVRVKDGSLGEVLLHDVDAPCLDPLVVNK